MEKMSGTLKTTLLGVHDPEWLAFLGTTKHDVYHLPEYVRMSADQDGGRAAAVLIERGEHRLFVPIVIRPVPQCDDPAEEIFDATSPYGYPSPLLSGQLDCAEAFLAEAIPALMNHLKAERVISTFLRLHPLLDLPLDSLSSKGTLVYHGESVFVDLSLPVEEFWRQTRQNHRRDINRAERNGVTVRIDDNWEFIGRFVELYHETMRRVEAADYYYFPMSYFLDLRRALGDRLHLCVVEHEGNVISAGLFTECCGLVQYHLSGTSENALSLRPLKSMLHFVRLWAKGRGNHLLNLGGGVGGKKDALYDFKVGFSDLTRPFYTWRLVPDETAYGALVTAWEARTGRTAESRDGFFPAYRA